MVQRRAWPLSYRFSSLGSRESLTFYPAGSKLDPSAIGITSGDKTRWKIFYDIDDILSFPTRNLFDNNDGIMDIQVDTADRPDRAHDRYWENDRVIDEVAELLVSTI